MTDPETARAAMDAAWHRIADGLVHGEADVEYGRMMSSPAVTLGGKVFAFYCANNLMTGIGARLGRDFDVDGLGLTDWSVLSPFKSKPPLKDWIVVGPADMARWSEVARLALKQMRG